MNGKKSRQFRKMAVLQTVGQTKSATRKVYQEFKSADTITPHKILTNLETSGELKILVKNGFCSTYILRNLELYRYIDARLKTGSTKKEAVTDAEIAFKMCRATVFNILKTFE